MSRRADSVLRDALRAHLVDEVNAIDRADAARQPRGQAHPSSLQRRERRRSLVITAAVAAALVAAIAGITAVTARPVSPATHGPAPTPSRTAPSPSSPPEDVVLDALTKVVGSGTFTGPITGRFTITNEYGSPTLHLRDLDVGKSKARSLELGTTKEAIECGISGVATLAGTVPLTRARSQNIALVDSAPGPSDLSYMKALAVLSIGSCDTSSYSVATIHWSIPAALKSTAGIDHGAKTGAAGLVTTKHGRPTRYRVAAGDAISAVADRFGITTADVFYLNPLRHRGDDINLYTGETLNLDPLDRAWFSAG